MKDHIFKYYEQHKRLISPIFGDVRLLPQSLWHLENKDSKHKRSEKETLIRYKCFLLIHIVIQKSHLYQEYKQETQIVSLKKRGKQYTKSAKVQYFGLIGIIQAHPNHWIRIKVVLKKVVGWNYCEFISVIPAWNMKGYNRLYFDDNL